MKKNKIDPKVVEKLRIWLSSPKAKIALKKAAEAAKKECEEMNKRLEVSDEQLRGRITI